MRQFVGCLLLLLSIVTVFVTMASVLFTRLMDANAPTNVPLIVGVVALAILAYCIGMSLLTSIRGDAPRRGWPSFRRAAPR